jgi:DNA-binding NtrC family response regulator
MIHDDAPFLTFLHRGRETFRVRLHRKMLIGRGHACDVLLPDEGAEVSREHAILRRRSGRIVVEDLSQFGTFLDGVAIGAEPSSLLPGAELRIGEWTLRIEDAERSAPTETRPPWSPSERAGGGMDLLGESPVFLALLEQIRRVAPVKVPVLIEGETGTGKERVARAVHRWSGRCDGPFEAVNCAAIPDGTAHSELFGHARGAFTGASAERAGIFERGNGGTVFLDEVGELSPAHQAMLLRVLEERQIVRLGGRRVRAVDFRLVAATHRDLVGAVATKDFREDLLYRLRVAHLVVPPLRDRGADVLLLARHFLEVGSPGRPPKLTDGAIAALRSHAWPGNVRELRNAMQQSLLNCTDGAVGTACLPQTVLQQTPTRSGSPLRPSPFRPLGEGMKRDVAAALEASGGNRARAARMLGISRSTLYDRMRRLWPAHEA